jgi:uncharacterized protein (DUF885 family)
MGIAGSEDEKFQRLVDEYLEFTWKNYPLKATASGIHTYDDHVQSFSLTNAKRQLEDEQKFVERFRAELDYSALNESNRIDYTLIAHSFRQHEFELNRAHTLERDPSVYPQAIAEVGFLMFSREYAPFTERMDSLARRVEKFPQILEEGKNNLRNPPRLWTEIGIQTTKGAIQFYETMIGQAAGKIPEEKLRTRLSSANSHLLVALRSYQEFLEKELIHKSSGHFADGRENFVYRLKNFYLLDQSPEEIKATAEKVLQDTKKEMEEIAKKVDPNKQWWEILEEAKKKHFSTEEVLPAYRKVSERARQWVIEKKLVSIPEEHLEVLETPSYMRYLVPYAAYYRPAPFEKEQRGYYFVTPVDETLTEEQKEARLGELFIDIENTTAHEAYPGHHLQFILQNRLSKIRRLADTPLLSEGWGLYCERLGEEYGFYSGPVDRLQAYRWLLVRAVRVILDIGLHCEGMDFEAAVQLMVNQTGIVRSAAEGEVRRYTQNPTQPLSYLVGMLMIQDLREQFRKSQGPRFQINSFHDKLLSYGAIPIELVRDSLL